MDRETMLEKLQAAADPEYREFHRKLLAGEGNLLGVRTPRLRQLAKELLKEDWRGYISQVKMVWEQDFLYYDEKIIWALCICGGCRSWEEARPFVEEFIPVIDSWAVCDIFCSSLKAADKAKERVWDFILPYFSSEKEYEVRFASVMLLSHFTDEIYAERALKQLDQIRHEGYYAKMAAAWAISVFYVKFPAQVTGYLKESSLDDWTYNKALQKITESLRVDKETKKQIRAMKR